MSSPFPLLNSVLPYGQRQCWYFFAGLLWSNGVRDAGHLDRILFFLAKNGTTLTESTIAKFINEYNPDSTAQLPHFR